ncbi:hypothetical protein HCA61_23310 [Rhodococcus sp. HNM0563]|uniref:hypothetical protein n=1 Tax=unclassified Rhodococcus (in: high G+C Gram-positive bacteria) TaxID=192944 RepID=UPI00146BC07C|nr:MULTISPECIES: hypothetical protein [unclassified Rhodococcus (in: high G+C Gram-positive bacteria)]MCK0093185.1 hypothetical protein [Rhodococcus sp. F64268]NLU65165.1 hypothetical protein [Rhodococcus sp. HNM0563]
MRTHTLISTLHHFFAGLDAATLIHHGIPIPSTHLARTAPDADPQLTPPGRSDPGRPDSPAAAA